MKVITFVSLIILICFFKPLMSQKDSTANSITSLNTFKTKDDFFKQNKKFYKSYIFDVIWETAPHLGYKVPRYYQFLDTNFFGYEIYSRVFASSGSLITVGKTKWIKTGKNSYNLFGGGTINAYCIIGAYHAKYDIDGYAKEVFYMDYYEIYYEDVLNNISTNKIEVFLKSKPKLLEKYNKEKEESDKKAWKRAKLEVGMKYLKLFNAEK